MSITDLQPGLWPRFSHHSCCVLILYVSGGTYSLTSTTNDRFLTNFLIIGLHDKFLRNFTHVRFTYSLSFCQISAERKSLKKYFLYFVLMSGLEFESWQRLVLQLYTLHHIFCFPVFILYFNLIFLWSYNSKTNKF